MTNCLRNFLFVLFLPSALFAQGAVNATINAPRENDLATNGDRGIPMLVKRCDTWDQSASSNGRYGVLCTDEFGNLRVVVDGELDATGAKTNNNEAPTNDHLPVLGAIASSTAQAYTTGRLVLPRVNLFGHTAVFLTDPTTGGTLSTSVDVVEDAPETAGGSGPFVQSVRRDTAASSAGTSGDNASFNTDGLGRLWVREGNPCADPARIQSAAISESTAATNEIVALASGETIYVCSYKWVTTAANSLRWTRGTGTDCATGLTHLEGAQPFAANGGVAESGGGTPLFPVTASNALCLTATAATAVGGRVSYVRTSAP